MTKQLTINQFREWYDELPILAYGELSNEDVLSAFKQILIWKSEGRFISGPGANPEHDIPKSAHNFTVTEYWLYLGLLTDCIEYGSSPRGAWLTDFGKQLLEFLNSGKHLEYLEEN